MAFSKRNNTNPRADPVAYWFKTGDEEILPGYISLSNNEEINRCIYKIADLVSNMTIMLMENGESGDKRLKNELSHKIDINPNSYMTRKTFVHRIVTDLYKYGNSVVFPRSKDGLLGDMEIFDARQCSFPTNGRRYEIDYKGVRFSPDEVMHFVLNPDESNPFMGQGITKLLRNTVRNLAQANATKTRFLRSKWKPSMIISIQADAEELQDKNLREKILGSYTETTDEGEPWLIPAGEIDVKTVQPLTLNDLAIQDSITLDIKTIAATLGIPLFMMGVGPFNKDEYNNFIATTIMSTATILQQEYSKKLLYSSKMYCKFNPKSLMQYNLSEKVSFVKEMVGGGLINRNEGRNEFDYSPVDEEGMNSFTVLENYLQVKDLNKQKKLIQDEGGGNDE